MHFNPNEARTIIMKNYESVLLQDNKIDNPITVYSNSCADTLVYEMDIKNNKIAKLNFNAKGCAIFLSSTKILTDMIVNKDISDVLKIIQLFEILVKQERALSEEELLTIQDLWVFFNVKTHLNRVNCALLTANEIKSKLI